MHAYSTALFIYLFIYVFMYLFIYLFMYLFIYLINFKLFILFLFFVSSPVVYVSTYTSKTSAQLV